MTEAERKERFKAWALDCRDLFRSMTGELRANGVSPGATVNGQKAMRYAEDPNAWAVLFRSSPAAWRSEVVEVFNDLNHQLAKASLKPFQADALRPIEEFMPGSAGDAGGTTEDTEDTEAFA